MSPAGRSVIILGILTGLQRRLLFSAPLHGIDAPGQGSGKTLAADCIAITVTGRRVSSISANVRDAEEFRKKLISVLMAGDAVVSIDNVTRPLENDTLSTILTVDRHQDRILGVMGMVEVLTNVLFLCTGNNLEFSCDMPSRVISGRIEPDCERPDMRSFHIKDLRSYILKHRVELVTAALTILQAYHFRKDEAPVVTPYGRFEEWSREIREPMIWAGFADPCETRESVIATDPERDASLALLENWYQAFKEPTTLRELTRKAVGYFNGDGHQVEGEDDLKAALLEVAADSKRPEQIDHRLLAAWCRGHASKVIAGFKLARGKKAAAGFMTWQVTQMEKVKAAALETNHKAAEAQPSPAEPEPVVEKEFESL